MRVAIIGSRSYINYAQVKHTVDEHKPSMIISGGAEGADSLGQRYAKENGIPILIFYPNWKVHGKSAGYLRNESIIDAADCIIAFWDGESKGTLHSINLAKKNSKKLIVINEKESPF